MSRKIAGFLIILGVFMIFEWVNLGFNLADGHPTSFYVVHGILIAVNIILAIVLGIIGWRGLRGSSAGGSAGRSGGGSVGGSVRGRRGDDG
ncbi:SCO4848 family membrane protein [Nonomuraea sp. MTCD27]|uniref:SCO4848 family membrane protein n=1 Tax=Nonomuraea sp. MTCD27 TaxID=1676747 RepID=UPI0035BF2AFB